MKGNLKMDFEALAELSRLEFDDSEKLLIEEELDAFVELLGQVSGMEISCLEEEAPEIKNVFREDEAREGLFSSDEMLFNAKTKKDGYITVPRVVGEENDR